MSNPLVNEFTDSIVDGGVGGYVRWRGRMVRASVFNDLNDTLDATGWTNSSLRYAFEVREFFAEFASFVQDSVHVNTLVLDDGDPSELVEFELGGELTRAYRFNMAFYAQDDDTGLAVFSDLADRYDGLTAQRYVPLYNYNLPNPPLVRMMEVESFQYTRAPQDAVPWEHHLFFAELIIRDFVSSDRTPMQP